MNNLSLTTGERHQLLSVLREFDHEAPVEQRVNPRRKVRLSLFIRTLERHASPIKCVLVNVSVKGVALLVARPMEKGTKFLLPLRFSEGGGWLVLCEAVNCSERPQEQWKVGAKFMDRIDDPQGTAKPPLDWLI